MAIEPGPELLQAHTLDANAPIGREPRGPASGRVPGNRLDRWDVVLQIAIALALLVSIVVLIRHYRGR